MIRYINTQIEITSTNDIKPADVICALKLQKETEKASKNPNLLKEHWTWRKNKETWEYFKDSA